MRLLYTDFRKSWCGAAGRPWQAASRIHKTEPLTPWFDHPDILISSLDGGWDITDVDNEVSHFQHKDAP